MVVLDTVAVGVVVEIVLVVVGLSVFIAAVVVVGVTAVEGSGVVVVVVLAEIVVLGLTTTNKTEMDSADFLLLSLSKRQHSTLKPESGDVCFFKV